MFEFSVTLIFMSKKEVKSRQRGKRNYFYDSLPLKDWSKGDLSIWSRNYLRIDVNAILSKDPSLAPAIVVMPRIFSIPETNNPIPSLSSGGLRYQQHSRSCTLCHMDGQQSGTYYLDFSLGIKWFKTIIHDAKYQWLWEEYSWHSWKLLINHECWNRKAKSNSYNV